MTNEARKYQDAQVKVIKMMNTANKAMRLGQTKIARKIKADCRKFREQEGLA